MLEPLRKRGKAITITIATLFIGGMAITGVSSIFNRRPVAGRINRKKISFEEYQQQVNILGDRYQQMGQEIDERTMDMIRNQAWESLIQQEVYAKGYKKFHIKVDKDVMWDKLTKDTPDAIKEIDIFKTDGVFDVNKMTSELAKNDQLAASISDYLENSLPYEMLKEKITADVKVSDEDVKKDFILKNNLIDAKFAFFAPNKIKDVKIEDSEIEKFYNDNKEKYKKGPARKLNYVKLDVKDYEVKASHILIKTDEKSKEEAEKEAKKIYTMAKKGDDFAELAKKYSEGPSASKGGDLGFFGKGRMVPEFEKTAFALEKGEISEPVLTKFGWHIIKKYEEKQADDINTIKEKAAKLKKLAQAKGLKEATKEMKISMKTTRDFYEDAKYISGIGNNENLVKFSFDNKKVGTIADLVENTNNFIVAEIAHVVGDHYQELSEVENSIKSELKREKQKEEIIPVAKSFIKKNSGKDIFEAAKAAKWDVFDEENIKEDKYIQKIGKDEPFLAELFKTSVNEETKLFSNDKGAFLAKVTKHTEPDMKKFEEEKETLKESLFTKKQNEAFNDWYKEIKDEMTIIDNRNKQ